MADQSKDVELRIRARDYSQKTLGQLTKIIGTLTDVMTEQQAAAERGEGSNKDLTATYQRLEDAGKQLLKLDALTKLFERQSKAVEDAAKATEEAKNKQAALADELSKVETVTKKQQKSLETATKQSERAAKAEESRRTTLARTADEMKRYGIDTANASQAQSQFSSKVAQVNAALERQSKAMDTLPAASRAAKLQQEANAQLAAQQQATAQQVQLEFKLPEQEVMVLGDSGMLQRCIVNLIGNAIKYGKPADNVQNASAAVECFISEDEQHWHLNIRDHGPGMDSEAVQRLSRPFERLEQHRHVDGVGLGLAFVRTAVERHGGQLQITSQPGEGSTFTLVLPKLSA